MKLTLHNCDLITNNPHVLELVQRLLKRGDNLVASDQPHGQFVCTCDIGTVQRIISRKGPYETAL